MNDVTQPEPVFHSFSCLTQLLSRSFFQAK